MKKRIQILIVCCFTILTMSAQLKVPALSPLSKIEQKVGLTDISVLYSRPSVKGRTIFGGILPFGEFWRAGANSPTKLIFSHEVTINKKAFAKGEYTILAKLNANSWELFFYPYTEKSWSKYVDKVPYYQIMVPVKRIAEKIETFEISFKNIAIDAVDLTLSWENTQVVIPIKVEVNNKVLQNIEKMEKDPSIFDYYFASMFLHNQKLDLNKALSFINKAVDTEKPRFFMTYRKALILKDLNRKKEALKVARQSLESAKEAKNKDFIRLNNELIKQLN